MSDDVEVAVEPEPPDQFTDLEHFKAEVETWMNQMKAQIEGLMGKYKPVSVAQMQRYVQSMRDSLNEFTVLLVEEQVARTAQNNKIASLSAEIEAVRRTQVTEMAAAHVDGVG